mmetsp:Transcript_42589/g.110012  ORF Transcript_42589/g.110012 Transcript_42589/m.110012 type:complete len:338 (-) Transcript_42589:488-1501(-)
MLPADLLRVPPGGPAVAGVPGHRAGPPAQLGSGHPRRRVHPVQRGVGGGDHQGEGGGHHRGLRHVVARHRLRLRHAEGSLLRVHHEFWHVAQRPHDLRQVGRDCVQGRRPGWRWYYRQARVLRHLCCDPVRLLDLRGGLPGQGAVPRDLEPALLRRVPGAGAQRQLRLVDERSPPGEPGARGERVCVRPERVGRGVVDGEPRAQLLAGLRNGGGPEAMRRVLPRVLVAALEPVRLLHHLDAPGLVRARRAGAERVGREHQEVYEHPAAAAPAASHQAAQALPARAADGRDDHEPRVRLQAHHDAARPRHVLLLHAERAALGRVAVRGQRGVGGDGVC